MKNGSSRDNEVERGHVVPSRYKDTYRVVSNDEGGGINVSRMGPAHTRKNFDAFFAKRGLDGKERFN